MNPLLVLGHDLNILGIVANYLVLHRNLTSLALLLSLLLLLIATRGLALDTSGGSILVEIFDLQVGVIRSDLLLPLSRRTCALLAT